MKIGKKKTVIFDFDGTLTDSMEIQNLSILKGLHAVGCFSVSKEDLPNHYGPTERGIISSIVPPGKKAEAWNVCLECYKELSKSMKPFDGILELLEKLIENQIEVFLVTGRNRETLDISLKDMKMESYFLKTYSGSDLGTNKEQSITTLFHEFDLSSKDVVYIGDTLDDIRMMRNISTDILSAGYSHDSKYQKQLEEQNPGNVCLSVSELEKRLMEITELH